MSGLGHSLAFTLLGYPVALARPVFLSLGVVALLLTALAVFRALERKKRVMALFAERHAVRLAKGISAGRPLYQASLFGAGLLLWALALSQPQCGSHTELVKRQGIDLVVALDVSASMLAQDVRPSRLERAKLELKALLDTLRGDRVGIVLFANDAFVQCPLTSDYAAAKLFLSAATPDQMPQGGTNIGAALEMSKEVLDGADRGASDRVIVLLSDGEDLAKEDGKVLASLREANIRVYAVGIGSEAGSPIPLTDKEGRLVGYKKDERGQTVLTRLDRAGLERMAHATQGEFFYRPDGVAVAEVTSRTDQLHKSEGESVLTVRYQEQFQAFTFPGTLLLALGMLPRAFWRRP